MVGVYQYARNANHGLFCGADNEDFADPDSVSNSELEFTTYTTKLAKRMRFINLSNGNYATNLFII